MARRGRVTIEDVASAAGVSRQTVSRVINRGPNVKEAVRARIESVIESLGYVPDLSARRMGGGRSFLILAINDRARTIENWQAGRGNDWVDQMLYGGMTECERHRYHFLFELVDAEPDQATRQLSHVLASVRPDGVVLTPPHSDNPALVALLTEQQIPCARIGHHDGTATIDIFMDESGAAHAATHRLIELGHRRLAFIAGAPSYGGSALRVAGFQRALADAGNGATGDVANGEFHFATAARVISDLLGRDDPPTAVIADNDEMAFAALHAASDHSLRVPQDISVVSFEDTPGVRFAVPPLTAVRQPVAELIAKACEELIAASADGAHAGCHELPYTLIERASTGPAPR